MIQVKNLGYFEDEEEAAKAYDTAARDIRGPEAELNFPPELLPGESRPSRAALGTRKFDLPMSSQAAVDQAVDCIRNAWQLSELYCPWWSCLLCCLSFSHVEHLC